MFYTHSYIEMRTLMIISRAHICMHTHMRADAIEQVSGHSEGVAREPQGSTNMQRKKLKG